MSDRHEGDDSDWLSSQFDATGQLPAQSAVSPPAASTPAPVASQLPPAPVASSPDPQVPIVQAPIPSAPMPNAGGGFNWGLKPGGTAPTAERALPFSSPVIPASVLPPPLVSPPPGRPPLVSPPTEPYGGPPTEPYVTEPTKPLTWDEFASTQQRGTPAAPAPTPLEQPTEAYAVPPWQPAASSSAVPGEPTAASADPTSAIDSLFSDHRFQEYEEVGVLKTIQAPPTAPDVEPAPIPPREPLSRLQKILMGVAAGLLAALILIGFFFLGEHLGSAAALAPKPANTGASSATPTPAGTGGPATPGVQRWMALQGGECIQPFASAWAETFTVVPCTADHDAEMLFKGTLPDSSGTTYPAASDFQKQLTALCNAPTAINYSAAASVTDLQVSFSYPPNAASWSKGDRTYYCFADRVSGGNLPGDLAVAKAP